MNEMRPSMRTEKRITRLPDPDTRHRLQILKQTRDLSMPQLKCNAFIEAGFNVDYFRKDCSQQQHLRNADRGLRDNAIESQRMEEVLM